MANLQNLKPLQYSDAGVDRDRADHLVQSISKMVKSTLNSKVKSHVGGYASIYELSKKQYLAASTDGVGTKLKLASEWNMHDTVGQDLVAMSVNDLLCVGAEPLFFLDYFATGKLETGVAERVIQGIATGCRVARCALVGGETAEMPGMYAPGDYDLAGFAVGSLSPPNLLPKKSILPGTVLIAIGSSGFHSNGFSLIRKIIDEGGAISLEQKNQILAPTLIYTDVLLPLFQKNWVVGAAHITGSGFLNVPRISKQVNYEITLPPLSERADVYQWLEDQGRVSFQESCQTFNQGIGMVLAVEKRFVKNVMASLKKSTRKLGTKAWVVGVTTKKKRKSDPTTVTVRDDLGRIYEGLDQ